MTPLRVFKDIHMGDFYKISDHTIEKYRPDGTSNNGKTHKKFWSAFFDKDSGDRTPVEFNDEENNVLKMEGSVFIVENDASREAARAQRRL